MKVKIYIKPHLAARITVQKQLLPWDKHKLEFFFGLSKEENAVDNREYLRKFVVSQETLKRRTTSSIKSFEMSHHCSQIHSSKNTTPSSATFQIKTWLNFRLENCSENPVSLFKFLRLQSFLQNLLLTILNLHTCLSF